MRIDLENRTNDYMLYFSAPWCAPCKHLRPIMEKLSDDHDDVDIFYVDVDDNQELAMEHRVMAVPTVKFFVAESEVASLTGLQPETKYNALIQEHYYEV